MIADKDIHMELRHKVGQASSGVVYPRDPWLYQQQQGGFDKSRELSHTVDVSQLLLQTRIVHHNRDTVVPMWEQHLKLPQPERWARTFAAVFSSNRLPADRNAALRFTS